MCDALMTDAGAGYVNRDKEGGEDNRYSVFSTVHVPLSLSVTQWISGDGWPRALQPLVERCHQAAQDKQM